MQKTIEKKFYYHFKHKPEDPVNHLAYEVLGMAKHSEDESTLVIYRPMYIQAWKGSADFLARPYEMFIDEVHKPEFSGLRFRPIDDQSIIEELKKIRDEMYGDK
jgi:hypothetical protein